MTEHPALSDCIDRIKHAEANVRAQGCAEAALLGAAAIPALADLLAKGELEVSRTAKRALWSIAHHAGRPDSGAARQSVTTELVRLLEDQPVVVRREALWMLSVIGGDEVVPAVVPALADPDLREDARCTLERLPGPKALAALQAALASAPEEFKTAIAHSLRVRGVTLSAYPERKFGPAPAH